MVGKFIVNILLVSVMASSCLQAMNRARSRFSPHVAATALRVSSPLLHTSLLNKSSSLFASHQFYHKPSWWNYKSSSLWNWKTKVGATFTGLMGGGLLGNYFYNKYDQQKQAIALRKRLGKLMPDDLKKECSSAQEVKRLIKGNIVHLPQETQEYVFVTYPGLKNQVVFEQLKAKDSQIQKSSFVSDMLNLKESKENYPQELTQSEAALKAMKVYNPKRGLFEGNLLDEGFFDVVETENGLQICLSDIRNRLESKSTFYRLMYDLNHKERLLNKRDYVVFYHGQQKHYSFINDLYTALVSQCFNSIIPNDYLFLRSLNKNEIENIQLYRKQKGDHLCTNCSLVTNCRFNTQACSLEYFYRDHSHNKDLVVVRAIFTDLGLEAVYSSYEKELEALYTKYREVDKHGRLLQVAIPKTMVDEVVRLADTSGRQTISIVIDNPEIEKKVNDIIEGRLRYGISLIIDKKDQAGFISSAHQLIETMKRNPEKFDKELVLNQTYSGSPSQWYAMTRLETIEFVMKFNTTSLYYRSGIKIIPYEMAMYAPEGSEMLKRYQQYRADFDALIEKIAADVKAKST